MANYANLIALVNAAIKTNGIQAITGQLLQTVLGEIIGSLGTGYQFIGIATPATNPGTPDQNVCYIAGAGTYTHFNNTTIDDGEVGIFLYNGAWAVERVSLASANFLTISTDVPELGYDEGDPQTISDQMGHSIDDVLATGAVRFVGDATVSYYKVIGRYGAEGGYITFIGEDNIYQFDVNAGGYITDEQVTSLAPDDELSDTSENAVQNKVVKAAFDAMDEAKQDVLTFDDVPTENSNNPVKSGGVKAALDPLVEKVNDAIEHTKNLADYAEVIDGYVDSSGKFYSTTSGEKSILFPCEQNTYYTISKILSSRFRVACFSVRPISGTSGAGTITDNTATAITIATGQDSVYIVAFVYNGTSESVSMSDIVASLQIEKGTQATDYIAPGWSAIDKVARKDIDSLDLRVRENETQIEELTNSPAAIALNAINYGYKVPIVVNGADVTDITAWSTENGATLALGKAYNNITRMSRKVMTITSTSGNGRAFCNLDTPANSNLNALLFEFCINYPGNTVPGNVVIELWSGTTRDAAHKRSIMFQLYGGGGTHRNGWHQACIFFSSAQSFFVNGASFDETAVTAVGLQLYNTGGVAYSVSVARMDFVPSMQKPGIVTIVDNFGVSVPAMADYAHSKGVRLNLSIIPGAYTGAPGVPVCATKAELDRVASQGHCIWNHTYTHQVLNNLTFAQIQDQINLAEQWMEENGYGKDCDFLSIPSASFNTETSDAVFESNVRTIFHNWCYNHQMVYVPYGPVMRTLPVTLLDSIALSEGKTPADIASVAAKCVTYNGLAVIGFHGTYWELDNGDSWKAYIDAIAELGVYHYGIDELVAGRWY